MSSDQAKAIYSVGAVARMLDVSSATLRNWEDRYGLIRPQRSAGSHRLYTREQLKQLLFLKEQIDAGATAGDAHRLLEESLAGSSSLDGPEPRPQLLVLIAERDRYAAEYSEFFLHTEGYEVTTALDVEDARRTAAAAKPAIAVVELLISGGSGLELIRSLSEADTQVIAVSTLDRREESLNAGSIVFLLKPVDPLQLVSAVKDLLRDSALLAKRRTAALKP